MRKAGYGLGYELIVDLPAHSLKRGAVFKWNREEQAYTTSALPWYLTPMLELPEIKNRKLFKKIAPVSNVGDKL